MPTKTTTIVIVAAIAVGLILIAQTSTADNSSGSGSGAAMISQTQLAQTEGFEGFSATAYPDGSSGSTQLYSIGYGHQIQPSESYLLTATISQAQAEQMLLNDMQPIVDNLNGTGLAFTQGQFDALTDFGYNTGIGELGKAINAFSIDPTSVPALMTAYVYWHPVPGGPAVINQNLVNRRAAEIATYNS